MSGSDINMFYVKECPKIPIVFLHGNGESSDYFKKQIEYFSKKRTAIAPDTRGHGKSERGNKSFTLEQFAKDLKVFFDQHKIAKADIVGFSDGANIAIIFTLLYPERVNKLVLNSGNLSPDGLKMSTLLGIRISKFFSYLKGKKGKKDREFYDLMLNQPDISPDDLFSIDLPVLVIAGKKDMIKKKHTQLIADSIWESKLVFINGNHFIALKNSEKFNITVEKFLNER